MKKTQGFTLIELLVVVAIIGILATVVLASLGTARQRARDAAAKTSISSLRAQAELFATGNGNSYDGFCAAAGTAGGGADLVSDASTQTGNTAVCDDTASEWGAEVQLGAGPNAYFCVDSTGFAGEIASSTITAGSDYACN